MCPPRLRRVVGYLAEPNRRKPMALSRRYEHAMRFGLKKGKSADIVVLVRGGTYRLKKTVVFGLEDSPQGDSTITYAAYPGETPVFSSGRKSRSGKK